MPHIGCMRAVKGGNKEVIGEVLFYVTENPSWEKLFNDYAEKQNSSLVADQRISYKRLEGIVSKDGKEQILAPVSATATVTDGQITMNVTAQDLNGSIPQTKCDPFAYVVSIEDEHDVTAEHIMYSESESFDIPEGMSGKLQIKVRAKSMFDEVEESEDVDAAVTQGEGIN